MTLLNRVHVALWNRPLVLLPKAAQTHNNTQTATKRRLDLQNKHPERKSSSKDESIISGGLLILLNDCSNIMVKNLSQLWFQLSLQSDIFLMDTRLWLLSVADGRADHDADHRTASYWKMGFYSFWPTHWIHVCPKRAMSKRIPWTLNADNLKRVFGWKYTWLVVFWNLAPTENSWTDAAQ